LFQNNQDIPLIPSAKKTKVSHLVAEALADKLRKMKDEEFLKKINEVFRDPEIAREQHQLAEAIAENTNVEELPW
jgi:GTP-binding protein EngB required for normal cell division